MLQNTRLCCLGRGVASVGWEGRHTGQALGRRGRHQGVVLALDVAGHGWHWGVAPVVGWESRIAPIGWGSRDHHRNCQWGVTPVVRWTLGVAGMAGGRGGCRSVARVRWDTVVIGASHGFWSKLDEERMAMTMSVATATWPSRRA